MSASNTSYSDEFKAAALALLDAQGGKGSIKPTARTLGIPRSTLSDWYNGRTNYSVPKLRHIKRDELSQQLIELAHISLDILTDEDKLASANVREVAIVLGIAIDKMQLLTGDATERVESKNLSIYADITPKE